MDDSAWRRIWTIVAILVHRVDASGKDTPLIRRITELLPADCGPQATIFFFLI